jgi:hypothetical protein
MLRAHGSNVNAPTPDELYSGLVAAPRPTHPDHCNVQDPDAFDHVSDELSPDEEQAMYEQHMARLEDERRAAACVDAFKPFAEAAERVRRQLTPAGWHEAICVGCSQVLLVQDDVAGPVLCADCEEVAAARAVAV